MSHFKGIMRNKKGLTLVEVVVAMGLFGIIMVTLFPAFLITNLMNITSREFTDANFEAQSELEAIYSLSKGMDDPKTMFSTAPPLGLGYPTCTGTLTTGSCTRTDSNYTYIATFEPNAQMPTMTNIVITVTSNITRKVNGTEIGSNRAQLELVLKFGE